MKNILIIGAGGSLAEVVIDRLRQNKEFKITLFARNTNRISNKNLADFHIVEGDVMNYDKLKNAVSGQDIVYVNLAGNLEVMAKNIVKAMHETNVKRVIAISSIGIFNEPVKPVLVPYRRLSDVFENSGLVYTILRPDWFTNADEIDYTITNKGEPEIGTAISRKSIADFISKIVENPELHKNENIGISKP